MKDTIAIKATVTVTEFANNISSMHKIKTDYITIGHRRGMGTREIYSKMMVKREVTLGRPESLTS